VLVVETRIFTKRVRVVLDEEQYRLLQSALIGAPELGKVIPGDGGIRKLRWAGSGRGKRGGARVIYRWFPEQHRILMLFVFLKNVMADLSRKQLRELRRIVESELR
jgi:mRNA-degrading endonuclease RelE of RelBE toxin-antitoxin system